jgi:hypothetical protein
MMLAALLAQTKYERKVICITGGLGKGKTLSMSVLANLLRDLYKAKVYSNYGLKDSLPLNEITHDEQVKIVCIDEFEGVWQCSTSFIYDLLSDEEQKIIFIITAFLPNRLNENVRKLIDIVLQVDKSDFNTIKINGVNNDYEHEIFILDERRAYDAFKPAQLSYKRSV